MSSGTHTALSLHVTGAGRHKTLMRHKTSCQCNDVMECQWFQSNDKCLQTLRQALALRCSVMSRSTKSP
jgi:hypothetical protein